MKKCFSVLICLILILCLSVASAGVSVGYESKDDVNYYSNTDVLTQQLESLQAFKFQIHKEGIGYGTCPVFTGPSADSFRCANGRASVQTTGERIDVAGYDDSGWLLIRYQTNNGSTRVGYIPPRYVQGFKTGMELHFQQIPMVANNEIRVTDNPLDGWSAFGLLYPGEEYTILAQYTYIGDWYYIECDIDGHRARGFIEKSAIY